MELSAQIRFGRIMQALCAALVVVSAVGLGVNQIIVAADLRDKIVQCRENIVQVARQARGLSEDVAALRKTVDEQRAVIRALDTRVAEQAKTIQELRDDATAQAQIIQGLRVEVKSHNVTLSAYSLSPDETDGDPTVTATGKTPVPGKTAAVSRDLIAKFMGHKVYIPGHGVWEINDVMNARYSNSIDLCLPSKSAAKTFGRRKGTAAKISK